MRRRIRHFLDEQATGQVAEEFDIAAEIGALTRNVIFGYVAEKSAARVDLQLGEMDSAVLRGNLPRFRRMYFNLIMNAVDALSHQKVGILRTAARVEGDRVIMQVTDDGSGMTPEKQQQLLTDKDSLDGELHSLGFVFVRQTVEEFQAELSIDSEPGEGDHHHHPLPPSARQEGDSKRTVEHGGVRSASRRQAGAGGAGPTSCCCARVSLPLRPSAPAESAQKSVEGETWGKMILEDYQASRAQHPGSIFAIAITDDDEVRLLHPQVLRALLEHHARGPVADASSSATLRGRLEENEEKKPVLILKPPQSVAELLRPEGGGAGREERCQAPADGPRRVRPRRAQADGNGSCRSVSTFLLAEVQRYFPGQEEPAGERPVPARSARAADSGLRAEQLAGAAIRRGALRSEGRESSVLSVPESSDPVRECWLDPRQEDPESDRRQRVDQAARRHDLLQRGGSEQPPETRPVEDLANPLRKSRSSDPLRDALQVPDDPQHYRGSWAQAIAKLRDRHVAFHHDSRERHQARKPARRALVVAAHGSVPGLRSEPLDLPAVAGPGNRQMVHPPSR